MAFVESQNQSLKTQVAALQDKVCHWISILLSPGTRFLLICAPAVLGVRELNLGFLSKVGSSIQSRGFFAHLRLHSHNLVRKRALALMTVLVNRQG